MLVRCFLKFIAEFIKTKRKITHVRKHIDFWIHGIKLSLKLIHFIYVNVAFDFNEKKIFLSFISQRCESYGGLKNYQHSTLRYSNFQNAISSPASFVSVCTVFRFVCTMGMEIWNIEILCKE